MKRSVAAAPSRRRTRAVRDSVTRLSQVLEGAEPLRAPQVDGHDRDWDHREGRGKRKLQPPIRIDDRPDELLVGDEPREDVVAERKRKGEDRARDDRRERERERDLPEG